MTSARGLLTEVENEEDFYFQMRRSVAILKVTLKDKHRLYYGGVFVDGDQNVITCNQNIPEDYEVIHIRSVEGHFRRAKLVERSKKNDLAMIKYAKKLDEEEKAKITAVEFADANSIAVGMEVYAVTHVGNLVYSFTVGQVAYPVEMRGSDCRLAGFYEKLERIGVNVLSCLIQLNNTHMGKDNYSIGCPVFNATGKLIGLKCMERDGFDYCYHANDIKGFMEKHEC